MADRTDTADEMLFDQRLARRNIDKGLLSKADYDKHIQDLADRSDNAEVVTVEDDETENAEEAEPVEAEAPVTNGMGDVG